MTGNSPAIHRWAIIFRPCGLVEVAFHRKQRGTFLLIPRRQRFRLVLLLTSDLHGGCGPKLTHGFDWTPLAGRGTVPVSASLVSALCFAYAAMKAYREGAENKFVLHPELIESLPRLSPLPGHTPESVNASELLEGANQSKVVYDASTEAPWLSVNQ